VARAPLSSSTTPLRFDSLALSPSNQDHPRNLLHPLAVTLSTSATVTFEIFGNLYLYTEEYHESWMEWWQGTPGYRAYIAKYAGKKKIRWNLDPRGTEVWKYLQQCADRLGSPIGTLRVMCIMCRKVLPHPSGTGTSSMHDHNRSSAYLKSRKINWYDGRAGSPLGINFLTLLQKGTKTGNRRRIIDLATPGGFNQNDFEEYFLKVFLATNLAFNSSNNLAFHRFFKYLRPGVEISSPTTLTCDLKRLGKSTVDDNQTCLPAGGKISLAADTWTSPNTLAFLAIVAYWISHSGQMEEVLVGFEEIRGSHTGANMAGIINDDLARYGIQDSILGFTTDRASNHRTRTEACKQCSEFTIGWMVSIGKSFAMYGPCGSAYPRSIYEFDQGEIAGWSYAISL